ncbi:hypothetical protein GCM10010191_09070 [Actinomadura vinacea]|uniref:DUF3040 domain-containing protein n=1 Tax=Actinomadura vinacea TaxID=115336 RepID=A0ABP5VHR2_9ACTN
MSDPYRISEVTEGPRAARQGGALRPLLWLLLVICASINALTSAIGLMAVSVVFGVAAMGCVAALIVHHYKHRRP